MSGEASRAGRQSGYSSFRQVRGSGGGFGQVVDHLLHLGDLLRLLLGEREAEVEGEVAVVGRDVARAQLLPERGEPTTPSARGSKSRRPVSRGSRPNIPPTFCGSFGLRGHFSIRHSGHLSPPR
jgi:hypothetical protein